MKNKALTVSLLLGVLITLGACASPTQVPIVPTINTPEPTYVGGDGELIVLVNNPEATNPTYAELRAFIIEDVTNTNDYVMGGPEAYVCADFAEEVHNNAESAGIKAAWVFVSFVDETEGHALNAFETSDRGLVYIDCTSGEIPRLEHINPTTPPPIIPWIPPWTSYEPIPANVELTKWDAVVYIEIGKDYGLVGINEARSLDYDFYLEQDQKWQDYKPMLRTYNEEVDRYNFEVFEYNMTPTPGPWTLDKKEAAAYNTKMREEFDRLKAWENKLKGQKRKIERLKGELGYYHYSLPGTPGVVEDIQVLW